MTTIYNKISVFASLSTSKQKISDVSIQKALVSIKNGELNVNGTIIDLVALTENARSYGKGSDSYDRIKKYNTPCVTWGSEFSSDRNKDTGFTFSGALYFDVDTFAEGQTVEQAKQDVFAIPCVKAVWSSFSGKGLGGIIYSEGNGVEYFNKFVEILAEKGYTMDKAVKDTSSRLNVLSYDPTILIKNDKLVQVLAEKVTTVVPYNNIKKVTTSNVAITVDGSKAHRVAYKYTSRRFNYISGERAAFITTYAGLANQLGLDYNTMSNEITKLHPDFDLSRAADIYNRYSFQFGTKSTDSVSYAVTADTNKTLNAGQYLSDILTSNDVLGKYFIAPTGTGKSFFIAQLEGKKVMIVPTQALSDEFATSYNGVSFNQFNKEVSNDDNLIFVTYSSYTNLIERINISEYDVFCDEAHLFVTGASREFMYNELNSVVTALENGSQKSTTLLTATPVRFVHPYLSTFETFKVEKATTNTKSCSILCAADRNKAVSDIFAKAKSEDAFVSVLLNNTKSQLDTLTAALSNYNVQTFSASKKSEDYFVELIETGKFDSNVDGFISTTVLGAGNSFKVGAGRNSKNYVVVIGQFSPIVIEQFAARVRDAKAIEVIYIRANDFQSDDEFYFDAYRTESELEAKAVNNVAHYTNQIELGCAYSVETTKLINKIDETYITLGTEGYEVDYLVIGNTVYEQEAYATRKNADFFAAKMAEYGYSYNGLNFTNNTLTDSEKDAVKASVESKKQARETEELAVIAKVQSEGLEANKTVVDSNAKLSVVESTVRFRLDYIYTYEKDTTKVFEVYNTVAATTQSWNKFQSQILIAKVLTDSTIKERTDRKLIDAIYAAFTVGDTLTSDEINSKFNAACATVLPKYKALSKAKTTRLFNTFFDVTETRVSVNGEKVRKYVVASKNNCQVDINTDNYAKSMSGYTTTVDETKNNLYKIGIFA